MNNHKGIDSIRISERQVEGNHIFLLKTNLNVLRLYYI